MEVRDSGPGIPPEEQKRIFEAFYRLRQAEKAVEGTGLGWRSRSAGRTARRPAWHRKPAGLGKLLLLHIAARRNLREGRSPPAGCRTQGSGESTHILVVEDDPAAAQLLQSHLSRRATRGSVRPTEHALWKWRRELQPAAVTMDIVMKPINGWELLSSLKSDPRTAKIPVIVVTIVDQPTTGALLGADEYIVKPVEKTTLLASVERCLNHARRLQKRGRYW